MHLSKKQKTFSDLFSPFLKSRLNFEHFEKHMNLIAYALTKIRTTKCVVRQMSNTSHFGRPYNTIEICTTASLPYLLINVKEIELE